MPRAYKVVRVNPSTNYRFLGEQVLDYFGTSGDLGRVGRAWKAGSQPTTAQKRRAAAQLRAINTEFGSGKEYAQSVILDELTNARSNPSTKKNKAMSRNNPTTMLNLHIGDEVLYKGKLFYVDDVNDETEKVRIYNDTKDVTVPFSKLTIHKQHKARAGSGGSKPTAGVKNVYAQWIYKGKARSNKIGTASSAAEASRLGQKYPVSAHAAFSAIEDAYIVPVGNNQAELSAIIDHLMHLGMASARHNPSKKNKPMASKKSKSDGSPSGKKASKYGEGDFVSDHEGEIYKVERIGDRSAFVKDHGGRGWTFDLTDLGKMKTTPFKDGQRVVAGGRLYTVNSHRFIGVVNAKNADTGKIVQLYAGGVKPFSGAKNASGTAVRNNPIRTKEGRVLVARGTRKQASEFMLLRKKMLELGLEPPQRQKIRGGWLTYESASWILKNGPAGSSKGGSTKPRKRSESAPRKRTGGGGGGGGRSRATAPDLISDMNQRLGIG